MHPDANRQCHGTRSTHQQNLTQSTQGNGHAFPLATVPQRPRTIPLLLETWHTKLGRLLQKNITPQHTTSLNTQQSSRQSTIQNTGNSSRTQEIPQNRRAQIITRKTKTSKNCQKSLKQRAQKITLETKLPKISKKLPSWRGQ
jgi:hypothetical protein